MSYAVELRDAVLNGVSLEDDNRQRFNEIQQVSLGVNQYHNKKSWRKKKWEVKIIGAF